MLFGVVSCNNTAESVNPVSTPQACTVYHHPSVNFNINNEQDISETKPIENTESSLVVSQNSIVNSNINIPEFDNRKKSSVLVYYEDDSSSPTTAGGTICGGLVISNTPTEAYVLTAAHCVQKSGKLLVATGEKTNQLSEVVVVDKYAFYPGYTKSKENNAAEGDIAWLKLTTPLQNATAVPVWGNPGCLDKGTDTFIVGYGKVDSSEQTVIPNTQKNVGVVKFESYHTEPVVKHTLLFTSDTGTGACFGDSGAGATVAYGNLFVAIGLTHGVHKKLIPQLNVDNACSTGSSIYTAIGPYVDWIVDTSGINLNKVIIQ